MSYRTFGFAGTSSCQVPGWLGLTSLWSCLAASMPCCNRPSSLASPSWLLTPRQWTTCLGCRLTRWPNLGGIATLGSISTLCLGLLGAPVSCSIPPGWLGSIWSAGTWTWTFVPSESRPPSCLHLSSTWPLGFAMGYSTRCPLYLVLSWWTTRSSPWWSVPAGQEAHWTFEWWHYLFSDALTWHRVSHKTGQSERPVIWPVQYSSH